MGQEDLKMAGGTQVMVPSNFSSALVLSSTRKSPTALSPNGGETEHGDTAGGRLEKDMRRKKKGQ